MTKDKLDKLIEKAKKGAKEDFLRFVTNIYNIDECVFEHIKNIPIVAPYEEDSIENIETISLSTKTKDELLDIIDEGISNELSDSDISLVPVSKIEDELSVEELDELKNESDKRRYRFKI